MKALRIFGLGLLLVSLAACGGGDSHHDYDETVYINWTGSVNGTIVVDATDDAFEFERDTGYLHFGSTTYTNAWVDDFANFWVDGIIIGGVYFIRSIDGYTITALVSNNGYYLDLYGPESDLRWEESALIPIYAFASQQISVEPVNVDQLQRFAKQPSVSQKTPGTAPLIAPNAIKENRPANSTGNLGK